MSSPSRRRVVAGLAGAGIGAGLVALGRRRILDQPRARVAVLATPDYDETGLVERVWAGLSSFPGTLARVRGARVVLKPNLVEVHPGRPINTHPAVVGAAVESFRRAGAAEVVVAEGPGHRRDTEAVLQESGFAELLARLRAPFVDLNVDRARSLPLPSDFSGLGRLQVAETAAGADLLVSVARAKTHHWAGVTLSLKNLFGVVPGAVYGWPKNPLHWAGIEECVLDLWQALRPGFAIVDAVVGMEGDGPIMGSPVRLGALVMGDRPAAVDATTARLMGVEPAAVAYLLAASRHGATIAESRIEVAGDQVQPVPFRLEPAWTGLRGG